ncbi:MAG: peptidase S41 [Lysobacteraceae bacterium]|nr:MAG: peptidase S41 [Xanthomonadaceae bacterium]
MRAWMVGVLVCALMSPSAQAADWRDTLPVIPAEALQRDVDTLEATYGALHPGLHRYLDEPALKAAYADLRRRFHRPQRLDQVYLALSGFAAKVRCGHTYANFYNQDKAVAVALLRHPRIPLYFRWIDGEMVVTRDMGSGLALPAGTRVLSLDGVPTRRILSALMPYARADGHNDAKRVADLQRIGNGRYEAFDVFYPLLYPRAVSSELRARVRRPGEEAARTVSLRMLPFEQADAALPRAESPTSPLRWRVDTPRPGVAVLRMPDWTAYQHPDWNWQAYLDRAFAEIVRDGVGDLVIDLRGNEGGSGIGEDLIAHLIDAPMPMAAPSRKVRYRRVADTLRPALSTWDDGFYDWGEAAVDLGEGWYRLGGEDATAREATIAPRAPRYRGRVWVLIGPDNSSATFEFAQTVQLHRLATLVGEPTGGNRRGINGGAFFFMKLPGSGIELDVPLIAQFPATAQPDAGVLPDIDAPETAKTIAAGRDVALEAVLARIDRK